MWSCRREREGSAWEAVPVEGGLTGSLGKVSSSFPRKPASHPWAPWIGAERRGDKAEHVFTTCSRATFPLDLLVSPWHLPAAKAESPAWDRAFWTGADDRLHDL